MKTKLLLGITLNFLVCTAQGEFRGMDSSYDCSGPVGVAIHCPDVYGENLWPKLDMNNIANDRYIEAYKQPRWKMNIQFGS
jgi:hypothetical protein